MGKILEIYNQIDKQIFIAIDESNKYPDTAKTIIENKKVLTDTDRELFNKWNEHKANKDFASADEVRKQLIERELL